MYVYLCPRRVYLCLDGCRHNSMCERIQGRLETGWWMVDALTVCVRA